MAQGASQGIAPSGVVGALVLIFSLPQFWGFKYRPTRTLRGFAILYTDLGFVVRMLLTGSFLWRRT